MALFTSPCKFPNSSLQFHTNFVLIHKPLFLTIPISHNFGISFHSKHNFPNPVFKTTNCCYCCLTSSADVSSSSSSSSSNIIHVKGLPTSILEGRLKTAFAQFGEVRRVNILNNKKTRKPFGSAYVWFACSEEAELAATEMNGKFLDGRFISVRVAIPGSCKSPVKGIPYKF